MAKKETKKKMKKQEKEKANAAAANASTQAPPANPGATTDANGANINNTTLDRSRMTADQLTQAQIEEAIKESQDPSSKLKKLRSPFSVRNCLLNILILVVLTVGIVILCCYLMLDRETFNLLVVLKDIFQKFGITDFFKKVGVKIKGIFK